MFRQPAIRTWILVKGNVASLTNAVSAMMDQPKLYGTCTDSRPPAPRDTVINASCGSTQFGPLKAAHYTWDCIGFRV